jgi:8-amino-7-oxononanoate synthase
MTNTPPSALADQKRLLAKNLAAGLLAGKGPGGASQAGRNVTASLDTLPEEFYRFSNFPEYSAIGEMRRYFEQFELESNYFAAHTDVSRDTITVGGRSVINYSGYNYLGLSGDPRVADAVKEAVDQYGTSVSASRIASGNIDLHETLEREIADMLGVDDCVVTVGGYIANVSTIGYLCRSKDLILYDELVHNSIISGCVLSGARRMPFPHNDCAALESLLKEHRLSYERVLILTEGVYSMDGDVPDIARLIELKKKYKALLMVDEAHSFGVIGKGGYGVSEYCGVSNRDIDIVMGTLSKSFGSCGGFIAGSQKLIEMLEFYAPGLVLYSAGISPPNAAAALAALRIMREEPERVQRVQVNARLFVERANAAGLNTGLSHNSAVVPVILPDSDLALRLVQRLFDDGVSVHAMVYPVVPRDMVRLRFFITACHTEDQITFTVDRVAHHLRDLQPASR